MAKCPRCGTEVANPLKTWSMVGRPSKTGKGLKLTIGLYECPECKKKFRVALGKERVTIKSMVKKIKGIEEEFMLTLKSLREKIKKLESERADLLLEIDKLKKAAEEKASVLESEVAKLRKEVQSLKELLGSIE